MYGVNGGYDSRPMNTGGTDTGVNVSGTEKSAFFQQVAVNAEAVSNEWNFNAYALIPVGDTEQQLNSFYQGGALDTYGLDVGYFIIPELNAYGIFDENLNGTISTSGGVSAIAQISNTVLSTTVNGQADATAITDAVGIHGYHVTMNDPGIFSATADSESIATSTSVLGRASTQSIRQKAV